MLEHLKGGPVTLDLWDRESLCIEEVGGGIEYEDPSAVVILLDFDSDWVVYKWRHTWQIVIVPACDVICIASDLLKVEAPKEEEEVPCEGDWTLLADTVDAILDLRDMLAKGKLLPCKLKR